MTLEDMLKKLMNDQAKLAANVRQYQITTQNLEKQVGKLASAQNSRLQMDLAYIHSLDYCTDHCCIKAVMRRRLRRKSTGTRAGGGRKKNEHSRRVFLNMPMFVKDIMANKSKLAEFETLVLTEECSSRILNKVKLPAKQKDPGSFMVHVTIGKYSNARGICELSSSINLMPRYILKKLVLEKPKSTTILLQLADHSVARPDGIIEDVLVQVGFLIFLVDIIVLDFEPDQEIPFILGRPFLAIGGALIDVAAGRLTMRSHDKVEVFDVYQALKLPAVYEELSTITVIDEEVEYQCTLAKEPLERVSMGQVIEEDMEAKELASVLDIPNVTMWKKNVEPLNRELGPSPKPYLEESPNMELKQLPTHLRYAFLGVNNTILVILSSALSEMQVIAALEVLKRHKKAIGWKMDDLHGISAAL
ncbi:uncharacterized protein LOC129871971 [Solanum dulcamara]|uniref:uncharacterized protein LOC129871971 n=1 Tax=Solanum dulcamara TaxID=45834 RepID=UPI0024852C10|nr:uncharacterized protein LOC129871971 [Solanum dulcamara]